MKKFLTKRNSGGGFTLVETLVSVSIFSMTLVAVMTLLGQGVSDTNYAKRKITAEYLAQEGIEFARNMRDNSFMDSGGWNEFSIDIVGACGSANGCIINADEVYNSGLDAIACGTPSCGDLQLKYTASNGQYGYSASGVNSGYTRQIKASELDGDKIKITSTVYWLQGSRSFNTTFSEVLFNWVN